MADDQQQPSSWDECLEAAILGDPIPDIPPPSSTKTGSTGSQRRRRSTSDIIAKLTKGFHPNNNRHPY